MCYTKLLRGLRDRALYELIYSCGLRVSEAVELELNNIFISEGVVIVHGKGEKERLVPLGDLAIYWLKEYLDKSRPLLASVYPGNSLFLNSRGEKFRITSYNVCYTKLLRYRTEICTTDQKMCGKRGS